MTIISEFRVEKRFVLMDENGSPTAPREYSKCRGNRYGYGKVLPQKIHFRVQKMAKMNFLKTNGSNLSKSTITYED